MKVKHNKKRNTAFVYEALVREGTNAILKKDLEKRTKVVQIIRKHFNGDTELRQDLECYRSISETRHISLRASEKIIKEASIQKRLIDPSVLFQQQTELIKDVNKELSPDVFNNFVPNYKTLATISQMFSTKSTPKSRVILESHLINFMSSTANEKSSIEHIDDIVYRSLVKKFNDKYGDSLLEEQKSLLTHYISSFMDNAVELKMFLNEELKRLKAELNCATTTEMIASDVNMESKTTKLIEELEALASKPIDEQMLTTILKTQNLVKELAADGDSN